MPKEKVHIKTEKINGSWRAGMTTRTAQTMITDSGKNQECTVAHLGIDSAFENIMNNNVRRSQDQGSCGGQRRERSAIIRRPPARRQRHQAIPGTDSLAPCAAIDGMAMPTSARITQG